MKPIVAIFRVAGIASLAQLASPVLAEPPPVLGYQGRILVNGVNHDGVGYFKFALVSPAAAESFWTNDGTNVGTPGGSPAAAVPLTVSDGLYTALLGGPPMVEVPARIFSSHDEVHLRVWFGTAPGGPFELLSPDRQLTSVGYALTAKTAAGIVPGYDVGGSNSLALQSVLAGGSLAFEATFTEQFSALPTVELDESWTVNSVTTEGFSASAGLVARAIDSSGAVGSYTSVAMINGRPAISYRDIGDSSLKYARSNDPQGSEWPASSIVRVDGAITDSGAFTSLAEVAGRPAISYYHGSTGDLRFIRAANAEGSSWPAAEAITIDGASENVGWFTSLAVVGGIPAISYYAPNAGELRYAWAGDAQGDTWPAANVVVVDGSGAPDRGRHSSLIDLDGKPAIAYHDVTGGDLRFASLSGSDPAVPGNWTKVIVDSSGVVGAYASLASVDGNPAIAYQDATNGNLKYARASDQQGVSWPAAVTVDAGSADTGKYAALAVIGGRPAIAYQDATNGLLKLASSSDSQGLVWEGANILTVDGASAQVGSYASMTSVNGLPAIAYHDSAPNHDLRFASLPVANWSAASGEALPVLASGVKDGAISSQMLSPDLGIWKRSGNHLYYDLGKIGIGRLPAVNSLEVEGSVSKTTAGSWSANSDRRIKTEIEPVSDALTTLQSVRLVSFRYTDEYLARHPAIEDQRYLNVIAQEFAQVFPEHVRLSGEFLPDGSEILQVDPYPLTIYAAAAVQELDQKLGETQSELASVRQRLAELERKISRISRLEDGQHEP